MNEWGLGSILICFAAAILVPGVIVHFTLGRKGGHRIFDKDGLSADQVKNLPFQMLKKRTVWNLRGSAATVVGLGAAMLLYPLGCLIGFPINVFGISDQTLIIYSAGVAVFLMTVGPAIYRKWRGD